MEIKTGEVSMDFTSFVEEITDFFKKRKDEEGAEEVINDFFNDGFLKTAVADYSYFYKNKKRKNYIFSSPLTKALAEAEINHDTSILKEDKCFYFEMPIEDESIELKCVYGFLANLNTAIILSITLFVFDKKLKAHRVFDLSLDLGNKDLKTAFEEKMRGGLINHLYGKDSLEYGSNSFYRTVLNGIIYIFNNCEEMNEKVNEFANKASKNETQKKIYTEKPYVELGKNFVYLRLTKEEEVSVRGHFRWQPCGEGRAQVKLTYVKPHSRDIKRVIDPE